MNVKAVPIGHPQEGRYSVQTETGEELGKVSEFKHPWGELTFIWCRKGYDSQRGYCRSLQQAVDALAHLVSETTTTQGVNVSKPVQLETVWDSVWQAPLVKCGSRSLGVICQHSPMTFSFLRRDPDEESPLYPSRRAAVLALARACGIQNPLPPTEWT